MQLVEHEELQTAGGSDELLAFLRAGQQQLQHHVVGQQDVRRGGEDPLALLVGLLTGVAGERHRLVALAVPVGQELAQLHELRVR